MVTRNKKCTATVPFGCTHTSRWWSAVATLWGKLTTFHVYEVCNTLHTSPKRLTQFKTTTTIPLKCRHSSVYTSWALINQYSRFLSSQCLPMAPPGDRVWGQYGTDQQSTLSAQAEWRSGEPNTNYYRSNTEKSKLRLGHKTHWQNGGRVLVFLT